MDRDNRKLLGIELWLGKIINREQMLSELLGRKGEPRVPTEENHSESTLRKLSIHLR